MYSEKDIESIKNFLPHHIAIIMDGNRRWSHKSACEKNLLGGHWAGAKTLLNIVNASIELGIKTLTVYGFSTENWKRSELEIKTLIHIFETYLKEHRQKMMERGIKFKAIGNLEPFPPSLKQIIKETEDVTSKGSTINFIVAINYGGRDDILRATKKIAKDYAENKLEFSEISEELMNNYLDTCGLEDPELLIRTSGEMRISNFLLWQMAYTEIYVTDVLWPDFTPQHLLEALYSFQKRQRRLGK